MNSFATTANNLPFVPNQHYPPQQYLAGAGVSPGAPSAGNSTNPAAAAAAVSSLVNFGSLFNQKDSRWLQLEVCREYQRNKCSRPDTECKFAHPSPNIEVQNGKVTACYDSIKARCNRDKPPCKYFHPPHHLKDQLLINGRNHLALKNAIIQQVGLSAPGVVPGHVSSMALGPTFPPLCGYPLPIGYLSNPNPQNGIPLGYACDQQQMAAMGLVGDSMGVSNSLQFRGASGASLVRQAQQVAALGHAAINGANPNARTRSDKVEVCREFRRGFCNRPVTECRYAHPVEGVSVAEDGSVTICMDHEKGRCARDPCRYFHRPEHMRFNLYPKSNTANNCNSSSNNGSNPNSMVSNHAAIVNQPTIYQQLTLNDVTRSAAAAAAAAAAASGGGTVNTSLIV